jgi:ApbE superfamily uncharacterized protein (UPF0280 family)
MFAPAHVQALTGGRLHLSHGPIDIVLKAWGGSEARRAAYARAGTRFASILPELCDELAQLRTPLSAQPVLEGPVARRMLEACLPFRGTFLTPMAAVAGAVADELMAHMLEAAGLQRVFVNNGGDIAIFLAPGQALEVGIAGEFSRGNVPALNGRLRLVAGMGVGGIATSGARGRSFSLGIADSVTVLGRTAAAADAAATLIANAVNVKSSAVSRRPARALDPDSDLGDRLVTVAVGALSAAEITSALEAGLARASSYRRQGLIIDAALMLAGETRLLPAPQGSAGPRQTARVLAQLLPSRRRDQ